MSTFIDWCKMKFYPLKNDRNMINLPLKFNLFTQYLPLKNDNIHCKIPLNSDNSII